MIEEITQMMQSRDELAKQAYNEYEPTVKRLIELQTKDVNQISLTLDYLLDFCFDDSMLLLYRQLCRYLYDIDPSAAADYVNSYREMWDEEGQKFGKNE